MHGISFNGQGTQQPTEWLPLSLADRGPMPGRLRAMALTPVSQPRATPRGNRCGPVASLHSWNNRCANPRVIRRQSPSLAIEKSKSLV